MSRGVTLGYKNGRVVFYNETTINHVMQEIELYNVELTRVNLIQEDEDEIYVREYSGYTKTGSDVFIRIREDNIVELKFFPESAST